MGKDRRKRSRPSETMTAWKPVQVSLPGKDGAVTIGSDHHDLDETNQNHYDDPKLSRRAEKDLPMNPGEDCAMFFGLEILDASQYQVVGSGSSKRLIITGGDNTSIPSADSSKKNKGIGLYAQGEPEASKKKQKKDKELLECIQIDQVVNECNAKDDLVGEFDITEPPKRKRKKRKKGNEDTSLQDTSLETETMKTTMDEMTSTRITPEELARIRSSWSEASGGAHIHERLLESLHKLGFATPTPIQAATLSASIMGRRNLVGAAPTGSGKTLAFLIPILNHLLENSDGEHEYKSTDSNPTNRFVQALIMTPTRELATQIHTECDKLMEGQCVTLVGGIALVKQKRLLDTKKPPIVIATPGRLWAMLSSGEHEHLRDLSNIRFLVLDEADRMTQEHSFPQLISILNAVHSANPNEEDDDEDARDESENDDNDGSRLLGLPGVRGEAQLTMLTEDVLEHMEKQKRASVPGSSAVSDEDNSEKGRDADDGSVNEDHVLKQNVHRQTFIYSATLTLPFTSTKTITKSKVGKRSKKLGLGGGIAEILEKTRAMGETKVVDLTSTTSVSIFGGSKRVSKGEFRLPPGLSLEQIKCTQRHKDSHLYAYLMTTSQGSSGPCLVFCNSIAAVRRVGSTLKTLGFTVRILHAHMQQRARFKAVESLRASKNRTVVVSTDVAARGLDIPSVSTVVHYDVARAVDTFVHRSGRTARGMGEGAIGSSLSLIAPAEDKAHSKIVSALGVSFHKVLLDGRLLSSAQERTNLASKIITVDEMQQKSSSHNRWFMEKAKEAELDLDDDLMEDESNRPEKEQQQILEAKRARLRLTQLLAEPMKKQKFGKFLSTNSEAPVNGLVPKLLKGAS